MTAMRYARPLLYGWKGKRAIPSLFSMPMMPLPSPLLIPYLCLPAKIFFETCKHEQQQGKQAQIQQRHA